MYDSLATHIQSLNRYAYVLNNPTTLTDPEGLSDNSYGHGFPNDIVSTDPSDDCSYLDTNDASCSQAAGLWNNGQPIYNPGASLNIWGQGGGGGRVWSEVPPPFGGGGGGLPCEFGDCRSNPQTTFVSDVRVMNHDFWMFAYVAWPFLGPPSDPGMRALWNAGKIAAPVASPWAPVAWYGTSTVLAGAIAAAPYAPGGFDGPLITRTTTRLRRFVQRTLRLTSCRRR